MSGSAGAGVKGGLKTELALPPSAARPLCAPHWPREGLRSSPVLRVLARSSAFADWRRRFRGERTCSRSRAAGTTFSSFRGHVSPVPGNLTREGLGGDWGSPSWRAWGSPRLPSWVAVGNRVLRGGGRHRGLGLGRKGSFGSSGPSTPLRVIWAGRLTPLGWVWPLRRRGSWPASGADSLVPRAALLSSV